MEWITGAWDWLTLNGESLWGLWASILAVATIIVNWTPTEKDDTLLSTIGGVAQSLKNMLSGRMPNDFIREQDPMAARERKSR